MNLIYIGTIVNTHGIKGEVRIKSDFEFKEDIFKVTNKLIIDNKEFIIKSYRYHKIYDMVTFEGIDSINDVLKYKGSKVYFNKDDVEFDGFIKEDLIGLEVYEENKLIGIVTDLIGEKQKILVINNKHLIPFVDEFIININDKIEVKLIKGLINED